MNEDLALGSQALTEDAAVLWALLEACHKDDGPVTQVSLIYEAMGLHTTANDFTTTPKEIVRIMEQVSAWDPSPMTPTPLSSSFTASLNFRTCSSVFRIS